MTEKRFRRGPGMDSRDRSVIVPLEPSSDSPPPKESLIAVFTKKIKQMRREGKSVIDFTQGRPQRPDFGLPNGFRRGKFDAINEERIEYIDAGGTLETRQALAENFFEDTTINYSAEGTMVGLGGRGLLNLALKALIKKNEKQNEVLMFSPLWPSYIEMVKDWGGKPIIFPLEPPNLEIDFKKLRQYVGHANLATVLINDPNNPTGKLWPQRTLNNVVRIVEDRNQNQEYSKKPVAMVFDSIYEDIIFDVEKKAHFPTSRLFKERAIIIGGASKTFNVTGLRLGWAFGPEKIIRRMIQFQQNLFGNPPSDSEYALYLALTKYRGETKKDLKELVEKHRVRRDYTVSELSGVPGLELIIPDATFYILVKIPVGPDRRYKNDQEFCEALLQNKGVGVIPGSVFRCPGYARLSLAVSWEDLKKGLQGIKEFVKV